MYFAFGNQNQSSACEAFFKSCKLITVNDDHDQTTTIAPLIDEELQGQKQAVLVVMTGPTAGQSVHLEARDRWTMGRSTDCDLVFQEASVSRNHCEFVFVEKEKWRVIDLKSSNGTFVNNEKISEQDIENGDRIQLGSTTVLKFVLQDEIESAFQKELYESATKDVLTNLFSKRYFLEHLDVEFNFHARIKKPLSLVIADIDHFKKINDTYGHLAGDQVLKELGRILVNVLRKGDVAGRYGGEEMVFLLRETPLLGARTFAERLRELISGHSFIYDGKKIPVTISLGAATVTQGNYKNPMELIKKADEYLYKAKKTGRNRTCCMIDS